MYALLNKIKDKLLKATPAMKTYVLSEPGWYRLTDIPTTTVFMSLLQIVKGFNTGTGSNGAIVAIEGLYNRAQASVLIPAINSTGIKKIRVLYNNSGQYYIDAYYDGSGSNSISFRFLTNILLPGTVFIPAFPTNLTKATVPSGYSSIEYDITKFGLLGGIKSLHIFAKRWWCNETV